MIANTPLLVVFADVAYAFDVISHRIIIYKLNYCGNTTIVSNRKQFVEIYRYKSRFQTLKCGVPQGSILGALLFFIWISDIIAAFQKYFIIRRRYSHVFI